MTTPTSDLKARLDDLRASVESEIDIAKHNGWKDDVVKWNEHLNFLSDLSRLLTPSDSDARKALEIVDYYFNQAFNNVAGGNATISFQYLETIRAGIFSLSAQLAEKERELEECHDELESNSHSISELTKVIENYQKKGAAQ